MSADYVLMKGNEAIAEAALRAGCRFYAGYPITPQSEILEYMSSNMEKYGGTFIQGENEIASMSMVYGASAAGALCMSSSSGPGFDLKQEAISYLAAYNLPCVLVDAMRYGLGDGEITAGQDSYWEAVRGGGHGDSRQLVFAPASVQEAIDLTYMAFEKAVEYRNVVMILTDGSISQMMEKAVLPPKKEVDIDKFDWTLTGKPLGVKKNKAYNLDHTIGWEAWEKLMRNKFKTMHDNEQRWEEFQTDDAEIVLVAIGISSRVCKSAVRQARKEGMKLGLLRPISVWPFPQKGFDKMPDSVKAYVSVEMSMSSQMGEDIVRATKFKTPFYSYLTTKFIPTAEGIIDFCKDVQAGKVQQTEVF